MNRQDRAREYLYVAGQLNKARTQLDALSVGDPSSVPNELKHLLDMPIARISAYARALLLGGDPPAATDSAGEGVSSEEAGQ